MPAGWTAIAWAAVPGLLLAGTWAYCVLQIVGARRYRRTAPPAAEPVEPISVLKPLHGLDDGLEQNLRSFFEQDYHSFELLFAARDDLDPGLALARTLSAEYATVPARFFVTGEPPWPNAKSWSLEVMMREARCGFLVMSDSDIRAGQSLLRTLAREFTDPKLAVATCPYAAVAGASFWSWLEAIGMNTEFWGGVFTARLVEGGVTFAVGPTVAARRDVIEAIGGWLRLSRYLAEDFVLGNFAAAAGHGVILSSAIVEHRIGAQSLRANLAHRLRWNRSTRRSRGAGYTGQVLTNPLPLALLLWVLLPVPWPLLLATVALRTWCALEVSVFTLRRPLSVFEWLLLPVQDLLSFGLWMAGFFGNTVAWRGRRYRLLRDGRFELV